MINNRGILSRHQYSSRMGTSDIGISIIRALNIVPVFKDMETISQIILVYIPYIHQGRKVVCAIKLCHTPIDSPTLVKRPGSHVFRDISFRKVL